MAAAAGLILALGIALGRQWRQESPASPAGFTALRYGSTTDRLEAIALVSGRSTSGPELQDALLDRVQHDSSPEVRLSAVEALYLFGSDPSLSRKLEAALPLQTRPEVQLALVDLLAAIRQERAADALRRLIQSGQLSGSVQRRAQQRLSQMNL
jgi:HEAT repeat protein